MKKILIYTVAMAGLAGCTYYDYYKGGIRYTQDGKDCVYYSDEYARHYSDKIDGIDGNKRIVYKNTKCADLFAHDNAGRTARNDRQVIVPAPTEDATKPVKVADCGCCKVEPVSRRFYTITGK
jgi:hypothetical protein